VDKNNGHINENVMEKQHIKLMKYLDEGKQLTVNEPRGNYSKDANRDVVLTSSTKHFVKKSDEAYNLVLILVAKASMLKHPRYCSSLKHGSCNFQFRVVVYGILCHKHIIQQVQCC
jgi:hypothetical protein